MPRADLRRHLGTHRPREHSFGRKDAVTARIWAEFGQIWARSCNSPKLPSKLMEKNPNWSFLVASGWIFPHTPSHSPPRPSPRHRFPQEFKENESGFESRGVLPWEMPFHKFLGVFPTPLFLCLSFKSPAWIWGCRFQGGPELLSLPQLEDLKNELEKRQAKKTPEISQPDTPAQRQEEKNQQPVREFSCFEGKSEGKSLH